MKLKFVVKYSLEQFSYFLHFFLQQFDMPNFTLKKNLSNIDKNFNKINKILIVIDKYFCYIFKYLSVIFYIY